MVATSSVIGRHLHNAELLLSQAWQTLLGMR